MRTQPDPTIDGSSFVLLAIEQGLLDQRQAEEVLCHSRQNSLRPSDSALSLSMLQLYEVEAIKLLCEPKSLAPGYELIELIGCGAGGMVFRARQTALDRDVALKTIFRDTSNEKTSGESRIQREARAIAQLRHPGIVAAFDSGFHQGRFCIVMEFIVGETLEDLIRREAPLSEKVAWHIARQVASALSHASSAGITHRDIKPANLLLCKPPRGTELPPDVPFVKVADFGLAFDSLRSDTNRLTHTGTTLGTPAYVAPEQLQDTHVDARADIYSLGATIFHMLSGQAPFSDQSPMRTVMQKTIGDDRWREGLPETISFETESLFREMTETNLESRIVDYDVLLQRIDILLERKTTVGASRSTMTKPHRTVNSGAAGNRSWAVWIAAATMLAVASSVGFQKWFSSADARFTSESTATAWSVDGIPQPLFNGSSVPLFSQSGSWTPEIDKDGSRVLVGCEGSRMSIPLFTNENPTPDVRLRLGLNLQRNAIVEVAVQFSDNSNEGAILRLRDGLAEIVHEQAQAHSEQPHVIELKKSMGEDVVFQRIAISRQGPQCIMSLNGEIVAHLACGLEASVTIDLRCVQDEAYFGDIDIVALRAVAQKL